MLQCLNPSISKHDLKEIMKQSQPYSVSKSTKDRRRTSSRLGSHSASVEACKSFGPLLASGNARRIRSEFVHTKIRGIDLTNKSLTVLT